MSEHPALDTKLLSDFVEMAGKESLALAIQTLEGCIDDYLMELKNAVKADEREFAYKVAHKFKSATSSLGLQRLQLIAKNMQHGKDTDWPVQMHAWLNELLVSNQDDIQSLKKWLAEA